MTEGLISMGEESVLGGPLHVKYHETTDSLVISSKYPLGSNGETVSRNLVAFHEDFDGEIRPLVGIVLEHASEELGPFLEALTRAGARRQQ